MIFCVLYKLEAFGASKIGPQQSMRFNYSMIVTGNVDNGGKDGELHALVHRH